MNPSDIWQAYNQITHVWQSDGFNMSNGIAQHERAIKFAKSKGKALDIGCGCTGRFIDLLLSNGFQPAGIDVSSEMIRLAKRRHPLIDFRHEDICSCELPDKYDFITAWDSIWHIPLAEQVNVITKIVGSLNVGGVFIFSFGGTQEPGDQQNTHMGPEVYYSSLGVNGFLKIFMNL